MTSVPEQIEDLPGQPGLADHGVLLRLSGCDQDGGSVSVRWKSYTTSAHGSCLRWEFPWFTMDCGYAVSGRMQLWRHLHDNWGRWQGVLLSSGLEPDDHMGQSRFALQRAEGKEPLAAEAGQEHWTTTAGFLALLADWRHSRRAYSVRERIGDLGRLFLERCVSGAKAKALAKLEPAVEDTSACTIEPVVQGRCVCLQKALRQGHGDGPIASPQHLLYRKVVVLSTLRACLAVRGWLRRCLQELATEVEERTHVWGDFNWHTGPDAHIVMPGGKRRRVDFHVKQAAIKGAILSGKHPTPAAASRAMDGCDASQGYKWMVSEVAAYRAQSLLNFRKQQVLAIAIDAGRIGKPAKELLVGFVSCTGAGFHGALPPQVLGKGSLLLQG